MTLWGRNREKVVAVSKVRMKGETRMCFTQAKLDWQGIGDQKKMAMLPEEELKFPRLAPLVSDAPKSY